MEEKNKKELIELVKSLQKEKQDLEKAYIELDLECRDLRTENEELKSNKFASWKLKFFNLKDELKKELAEHEEFTKKAKEEIERLTEERDMYADDLYWKAEVRKREDFITELTVENAELQKQVNELTDKLGKVLSGIKADELLVAKGIEQAVKDTAKEILQGLEERKERVKAFYGTAESIGVDVAIIAVKEMLKQKGVEVE